MNTRDEVALAADVYWPMAAGEFPVLLMRQPYGKAIASTVVYAHPRWYAAQGYVVVVQDVRGRGSSAGTFQLFAHEVEDGEDTVLWAAGLPGSNGRVGMYGFSYQGMTQLYAASTRPEPLKVLCPAMLAYDLYHDWAYEGEAFCLQASLAWALQIEAETARLRGDATAFRDLAAAARNLPLHDPIPAQPEILKHLAPTSFYHDWVKRSNPAAPYWRTLQPNLTHVDLPMLHIGGWFDCYLRGTIRLYETVTGKCEGGTRNAERKGMRSPQHLWIGPWAHLPWGRRVGGLDFGPAAQSPIDKLQLRWFNHFLKDQDTGLLTEDPVCLFQMGSNQWQRFPTWPPPAPPQTWTLSSTGLAALREDAGHLQSHPPAPLTPQPPLPEGEGEQLAPSDFLIHDPWRPVPALGGHNAFPSGPFERSAIDCRSDVLTYTTEPLTEPLTLVGPIAVTIDCASDAPSFDLCAILSQVHPNGQVYNFSQGYRTLTPPAPLSLRERGEQESPSPWGRGVGVRANLTLQPTCIVIPAGHRLRLSLSAACFPAFLVNPGTGQPATESPGLEHQVVAIAIYGGRCEGGQRMGNG